MNNITQEGWIAIGIAAIGLAGVVLTQWTMFCVAYMRQSKAHDEARAVREQVCLTHAQVEQINDAVNHRHKRTDRGDVPPKLFDLALENRAKLEEMVLWKRGYEGGPLDDGGKVRQFVSRTEERLGAIETGIRAMPCVVRGEESEDKESQ